MQTLILPGFSLKNKVWALEAQKYLPSPIVHEWKHWGTGENRDFNVKNEVNLILNKINSRVNILAKSAGTIVVMYILKVAPEKIEKLILCGIPINWENMDSKSRKSYEILKNFPDDRIKIFQNTNDPYARFELVQDNIAKINSKIEVIEKARDDHEYRCWEEFKVFFVKA